MGLLHAASGTPSSSGSRRPARRPADTRIGQHVLDMHDCPREDRAPAHPGSWRGNCAARPKHFRVQLWWAPMLPVARRSVTASIGARTRRTRSCDDRIEDRLHVGRRLADDTQDLAGRRLLLQRLGEVGVLVCSSVSSRAFSMAMAAWSAKVSISAIWLVGERPDLVRRSMMTPSSSSALSMGIASSVRWARLPRPYVYSGSARCRECGRCAARGRPGADCAGPATIGFCSAKASRSRVTLWVATTAGVWPSKRKISARSASHSRTVLGQRLERPAAGRRWTGRSP
jgi:hypothetical protein